MIKNILIKINTLFSSKKNLLNELNYLKIENEILKKNYKNFENIILNSIENNHRICHLFFNNKCTTDANLIRK